MASSRKRGNELYEALPGDVTVLLGRGDLVKVNFKVAPAIDARVSFVFNTASFKMYVVCALAHPLDVCRLTALADTLLWTTPGHGL